MYWTMPMDADDFPKHPPSDPKERADLEWMMIRRSLLVALEYEKITRVAKIIMGAIAAVAGAIAAGLALWKGLVEWIKHSP